MVTRAPAKKPPGDTADDKLDDDDESPAPDDEKLRAIIREELAAIVKESGPPGKAGDPVPDLSNDKKLEQFVENLVGIAMAKLKAAEKNAPPPPAPKPPPEQKPEPMTFTAWLRKLVWDSDE